MFRIGDKFFDPGKILDINESLGILRVAIRLLPEKYREVMYLFVEYKLEDEELSDRQVCRKISKELGVSEDDIRNKFFAGRERLLKIISYLQLSSHIPNHSYWVDWLFKSYKRGYSIGLLLPQIISQNYSEIADFPVIAKLIAKEKYVISQPLNIEYPYKKLFIFHSETINRRKKSASKDANEQWYGKPVTINSGEITRNEQLVDEDTSTLWNRLQYNGQIVEVRLKGGRNFFEFLKEEQNDLKFPNRLPIFNEEVGEYGAQSEYRAHSEELQPTLKVEADTH